MFNERELLILAYVLDMAIANRPAAFFAHQEADQLGHKLHRVLQATRKQEQEWKNTVIAARRAGNVGDN